MRLRSGSRLHFGNSKSWNKYRHLVSVDTDEQHAFRQRAPGSNQGDAGTRL